MLYYFLFFSCERWRIVDTCLHFVFFTECYDLNIAPYYFTEVLPIIVRLKRVDTNFHFRIGITPIKPILSLAVSITEKILEKKILGCSLVA